MNRHRDAIKAVRVYLGQFNHEDIEQLTEDDFVLYVLPVKHRDTIYGIVDNDDDEFVEDYVNTATTLFIRFGKAPYPFSNTTRVAISNAREDLRIDIDEIVHVLLEEHCVILLKTLNMTSPLDVAENALSEMEQLFYDLTREYWWCAEPEKFIEDGDESYKPTVFYTRFGRFEKGDATKVMTLFIAFSIFIALMILGYSMG